MESSTRHRTPAAARYVGLSPRTLEKKRVDGTGPIFIRLGSAVVYDQADLDAWLEANRRRATCDLGAEARPAG